MFSLKSSLALIVLAVASTAAHAECAYPKAPDAAPNGNTATKEEMVAGMQQIKKYNEDMNSYVDCVVQETDKRVAEAGDNAAQVKQIKELGVKKQNAAIDELTARTDEFNQQVRAFKAKQKG
jgi:hypothetical protein